MAELNPNIILQSQAPNFGETYANALLAGSQIADRRNKVETEQAARQRAEKFNALTAVIPEGVNRRDYLTQQGFGAEALELDKAQGEADKVMAEGGIKSQEQIAKQVDNAGRVLQRLLGRPDLSKATAQQELDASYQAGEIAPNLYQKAISTLQGLPEEGLREHIKSQVMALQSAKDQMTYVQPDANAQLGAQTQMRGQDITQQNNMANQGFNQNRLGIDTEYKAAKIGIDRERLGLDRDKFGLDATKASQKTVPTVNQGAIDSIDTAMQSLQTIIDHPGRESGTGIGSVIPSFPGGQAAGFDARLETFKAQTFVPMVVQLKGMGALSDAEGKKLTAAVGALDPKMGDEEFLSSARDIMQELALKKKRAMGDNSPRQNNIPPKPDGATDEEWQSFLKSKGMM